jgi:hypothetical protein
MEHLDALPARFVDVGLAVREEDDAIAIEVRAQRRLEPLGAPRPGARLLTSLLRQPLDERAHVAQERIELVRRAGRTTLQRAT